MEAEYRLPWGGGMGLALENRRGITKIHFALAAGRAVTRYLVAGTNGPQRDASRGGFVLLVTFHEISPAVRKGVLSGCIIARFIQS